MISMGGSMDEVVGWVLVEGAAIVVEVEGLSGLDGFDSVQ